MLRVMHIISDLDLGGAEVAATEMALRLDRQRFAPAMCCLRRSGPLANRLRQGGVPVHEMRFASRTSILGIIRLASLLRRERIDIAHTHLRRAGAAGRLAAILARTPCLVHHEHSREREPKLRQRCLYRWLTQRTHAVLCVSNCVRQERLAWTGADPRPFRVFYNFVDLERFRPQPQAKGEILAEWGLPRDSLLIGTIGRLSPIKNQALFLQAGAEIARHLPQARFLIVGDGKLRDDLENLARSLNLATQTTFVGSREDVERFYAAFDLFVLTSQAEGFGLAIVEAQACGTPVVCAAAGATSEVIADNISGLIVAPPTPQTMAEAMLRVLRQPSLAQQLRAGGLASAKRFAVAMAIRQLEETYLALCAPAAARETPSRELPPHNGDE